MPICPSKTQRYGHTTWKTVHPACLRFYADWLRQLEKRETKRSQKGATAAGSAAGSTEASSKEYTTAAAATTAEPMASSTAAPSNGTMAPGGGNVPQQEAQQPQQPQPQPQPQLQSQRDNLLQPTERTPEPNFLSLDNPVVFTAALLGGLVALSVVFH
eukprot:1146579-Pelagomonas_calceolata.AAC.2